ncbi:MAG: 50S ribosomal protein L19e [Nanoarchaeota archaeon]
MNLSKKKALAVRTFGVGKERIMFVKSRLDEIKEAITKQDIRDLVREGAIIIKRIKGRKGVNKRKSRSPGNIRKIARSSKREYILSTRKLRRFANEMKKQEKITKDESNEIRKKIRNRIFKSKAHLKEYIQELTK